MRERVKWFCLRSFARTIKSNLKQLASTALKGLFTTFLEKRLNNTVYFYFFMCMLILYMYCLNCIGAGEGGGV